MHLAKFGIVSLTGTVAKMAAAHDFLTYSQTYAHLKAAHHLGREASARDIGDTSIHQKKCPPD